MDGRGSCSVHTALDLEEKQLAALTLRLVLWVGGFFWLRISATGLKRKGAKHSRGHKTYLAS